MHTSRTRRDLGRVTEIDLIETSFYNWTAAQKRKRAETYVSHTPMYFERLDEGPVQTQRCGGAYGESEHRKHHLGP